MTTTSGTGLAWCPPRAYLGGMGSFLSRFNPFRAALDLRRYLGTRQRHEIVFLFVSFGVCALIVTGFVLDSNIKPPYKPPEIIYVQNWRADRSDAEIAAQQKIDEAKKKADAAKLKKQQDEERASVKRFNDKVLPWL